MNVKVPCKDCPDREIGCHSKCLRWAIYQREKNESYLKIKEERDKYLNAWDAEIKRKSSEKRKKRRKR